MKIRNLLFLVLLLLPVLSFAGVNLKNGNFYITYTDIIVPGGGHDLMIQRTYNSKSTEVGWFGFGWGSDFETFLVVSPDGSVTVHENGSGALNRFIPEGKIDPTVAAQKIVDAYRKGTTLSETAANKLIEQLKNDEELRQAYARKFQVTTALANGTVLFSNTHGLQKLEKIENGYRRTYNDGKVEFFNAQGKMTKVEEKTGYAINFEYQGSSLKSIKDSNASQLFFDWYPDGRVKNVWSSGEKKTLYKYDTQGNLTESTDIAGNLYKFEYDANHNMTGILYADKSKMTIKYDTQQFVSEVTNREGENTKYKYENNPKNPDMHYWTYVTSTGTDGKPVTNKYEYELKARPDGSQYTYRMYTEINGVNTETVYSDINNLPLKIASGKSITTFEYDKKGLLKKKSSGGETIELDYHPEFNKITRVKDSKGWTNFDYDKRGFLSKATNSEGKEVLLIYDRNGRITKMVDSDKKDNKKNTLTFVYNALGKPIEIAIEKVGKINVAYDNYGEIKKVESAQGPQMALQVTQAFQNLLAIVKPAGVNLGL